MEVDARAADAAAANAAGLLSAAPTAESTRCCMDRYLTVCPRNKPASSLPLTMSGRPCSSTADPSARQDARPTALPLPTPTLALITLAVPPPGPQFKVSQASNCSNAHLSLSYPLSHPLTHPSIHSLPLPFPSLSFPLSLAGWLPLPRPRATTVHCPLPTAAYMTCPACLLREVAVVAAGTAQPRPCPALPCCLPSLARSLRSRPRRQPASPRLRPHTHTHKAPTPT